MLIVYSTILPQQVILLIGFINIPLYHTTWWLIPLSKWVITPVMNGISRVNPLKKLGWTSPLTSRGMSHQVYPLYPNEIAHIAGWKPPGPRHAMLCIGCIGFRTQQLHHSMVTRASGPFQGAVALQGILEQRLQCESRTKSHKNDSVLKGSWLDLLNRKIWFQIYRKRN